MGRADLKPVAVGWGPSRRRCVCPRRYGQTHRGHGRKDEDARKRGRAFHERCSDLLLSHPGLTVVTRQSGAKADSCNGNRRTQSPRLRVHLQLFVLAKNLGSRKKLAQDPGGKAFTCTAATTPVVPLSGSSSGNQADRLLFPQREHFGRTCLIVNAEYPRAAVQSIPQKMQFCLQL